jgi:hypothetical protein
MIQDSLLTKIGTSFINVATPVSTKARQTDYTNTNI